MSIETKKTEVKESGKVKKLGWWDTIRFHVTVTIVSFLCGFVAPIRLFVPVLVKLNAAQWRVRTLDALREKHKCDLFWVPLLGLVVLDGHNIDTLLTSTQTQADPPLKKGTLSNFIPESLTISNEKDWPGRRKFNQRVLDSGEPHRYRDAFVEIVSAEVARIPARAAPGELRWVDFQVLAERISQQVLLGSGELNPELETQLERLVARSNFLVPWKGSSFSAFYRNIERYLSRQRAAIDNPSREQPSHGTPASVRCLMHDSAEQLANGTATAATRVPTQIGFWMFVLKDALELHVARTLALIAAHPQVEHRVRRDLQGNSKMTAEKVHGLQYLDACLREQLRLWTPVPMLLRRATETFSLHGEIPIAAGRQILMYPGYYHRDPCVFGHIADQFSPDSVSERLPPIYYFSTGRQACAGASLALFMVKATLASLLARFRFELIGPRVDPDRIPYLYDHFHVKFRAILEGSSESRDALGTATARQ